MRSKTLMVDGRCGLCIIKDILPDYNNKRAEPDDVSNESSHLRECRTCHGIYAVVAIEDANSLPKCHYCRQGENPPLVTCENCTNLYVIPDGSSSVEQPYICPTCNIKPQRGYEEKSTTLSNLLDQNNMLSQIFGKSFQAFVHIFDTMSLYKLFMKDETRSLVFGLEADGKSIASNGMEIDSLQTLQYKGKQIRNINDVITHIKQQVEHGKLLDACNLCFENKKLVNLQSACGFCTYQACADCLAEWYKQTSPGKLALPSHLQCPFCKRRPKGTTLRRFNKLACTIVGELKPIQIRGDYYYGWCMQCYKIKEAVPRTCAGDTIPELNGFVCEKCKIESEINLKDTKKCPQCKAPTVKIDGCNHILCTQCNCHWCYLCELSFGADTVYDHLNQEHGGVGFDY
eukprot:TRINITY_DN3922_c0_g1_i8.p1 TRINITY_DN3922_c0_g1~~TRINITY_DN3922_c0_g1_i8.p1  ORF type:complete len:449 (-),score=39.85 TRINITY_DN3922_c0_g1_i8:248-1450(-)